MHRVIRDSSRFTTQDLIMTHRIIGHHQASGRTASPLPLMSSSPSTTRRRLSSSASSRPPMEARPIPDSSRTERLESIGQSSTGSWEGGRLSKLAKSPVTSSAMRDRIEEEGEGQGGKVSGDAAPQSTGTQASVDVPQHIPLSQFQSTWKEKPRPQREGYGFRPRSGASTPTTPGHFSATNASTSGLTSQLQQHNLHHPRDHVGGGEQQDKGLATPGSSRVPESQYQDIERATQGLAGMNINARQAAAVREGKQRALEEEEYDEETDFKGFSADPTQGYFDDADDVDIVDAAGLGWPGEFQFLSSITEKA